MIQGDSTLIASGTTEADGGDSAAGAQFLKGMAVDHITSAWSSAELALGRLVKDMAPEPWGGRALAPWCGTAPWFGGCMVPGEEAGRAVSPDAAEAVEVGCRAASAGGNSCFKGG